MNRSLMVRLAVAASLGLVGVALGSLPAYAQG